MKLAAALIFLALPLRAGPIVGARRGGALPQAGVGVLPARGIPGVGGFDLRAPAQAGTVRSQAPGFAPGQAAGGSLVSGRELRLEDMVLPRSAIQGAADVPASASRFSSARWDAGWRALRRESRSAPPSPAGRSADPVAGAGFAPELESSWALESGRWDEASEPGREVGLGEIASVLGGFTPSRGIGAHGGAFGAARAEARRPRARPVQQELSLAMAAPNADGLSGRAPEVSRARASEGPGALNDFPGPVARLAITTVGNGLGFAIAEVPARRLAQAGLAASSEDLSAAVNAAALEVVSVVSARSAPAVPLLEARGQPAEAEAFSSAAGARNGPTASSAAREGRASNNILRRIVAALRFSAEPARAYEGASPLSPPAIPLAFAFFWTFFLGAAALALDRR
ncbi:MAG: hypothetical protein HY921_09360 [Elusimicrobia bacterium]|nr:hypothetical protein [Elusimicrobiota bacterium]